MAYMNRDESKIHEILLKCKNKFCSAAIGLQVKQNQQFENIA